MGKFLNITGQRFGRLVAVQVASKGTNVLTRIILFLAAAFIACVTALPVFAQSDANGQNFDNGQTFVQTDGGWVVCVNGACKPLSAKTCEDNYSETEKALLNMEFKYKRLGEGTWCGPLNIMDVTGDVVGLIGQLMIANFERDQACLRFAKEHPQWTRVKKPRTFSPGFPR